MEPAQSGDISSRYNLCTQTSILLYILTFQPKRVCRIMQVPLYYPGAGHMPRGVESVNKRIYLEQLKALITILQLPLYISH